MAKYKPTPNDAKSENLVTLNVLKKYKKSTLSAVIAVVIIVIAVLLYRYAYQIPREKRANIEIAKAQSCFDNEAYALALSGDSVTITGFLSIANTYKGTDAGNLATLYSGLCYAQLDMWEQAVEQLSKFKARKDRLISPAATAALGNALAHIGEKERAVEALIKAARKADSSIFSPICLLQAGELLENMGKKDKALALYNEIKILYPNSPQMRNIDSYIERASAE